NAPVSGPKSNPERQRRGPISKIVELRRLAPLPASKPFTHASIAKPMERAFSALASAVRVPSPLGWVGLIGAFGAPRCGGAAAPGQATESPWSKLQGQASRLPPDGRAWSWSWAGETPALLSGGAFPLISFSEQAAELLERPSHSPPDVRGHSLSEIQDVAGARQFVKAKLLVKPLRPPVGRAHTQMHSGRAFGRQLGEQHIHHFAAQSAAPRVRQQIDVQMRRILVVWIGHENLRMIILEINFHRTRPLCWIAGRLRV